MNQSYLLTAKNGDIARYNHNFILGQIVIAANQPHNIGNYVCKQNELKINACIYDLATTAFFLYPELIHSVKWKNDYLIIKKKV